jgi:hypothetical protein
MSWVRARYLVSVWRPSPGMISSLIPALAKVDWIDCASSVVGKPVRTSMVTLKPFGCPALASSPFARSTSSR